MRAHLAAGGGDLRAYFGAGLGDLRAQLGVLVFIVFFFFENYTPGPEVTVANGKERKHRFRVSARWDQDPLTLRFSLF